ncbi:MAG TPA: NAD(P)-binding domain-containing protein [Streptosporangiaceae bacterium]|nr:NAD(P)-binding domain-containing protein [Streptosporangiaceae bacterium]
MKTGDGQPGDLRVAVLGAGFLGSAVSAKLVAAGLHTTVWGTSPSVSAQLVNAGAIVAASPAEAATNAEVVITILPTVAAVQSVIFDGGVARSFVPGAVWAQMSTIGGAATADITSRLDRLRPDVLFVDAPVSGVDTLTEAGQLLILAAGPLAAEAVVSPAFSAICRRTVWWTRAARSA